MELKKKITSVKYKEPVPLIIKTDLIFVRSRFQKFAETSGQIHVRKLGVVHGPGPRSGPSAWSIGGTFFVYVHVCEVKFRSLILTELFCLLVFVSSVQF